MEPPMTVYYDYNDYRYATIDFTARSTAWSGLEGLIFPSEIEGCTDVYRQLPNGWEVVPGAMSDDQQFLHEVVAAGWPGWETQCVEFADGSKWSTQSGIDCAGSGGSSTTSIE